MLLSRNRPSALASIPEGRAGISATLKLMARIAKDFRRSTRIRELAISLTSNLPPKQWAMEARRLHEFVRDHVRYIQDINNVETIQTPDVTLDLGAGDCDDKATLLASLLESIGHPARFIAVGPESDLTHVYVETKIGESWFSSDTTEPVAFGWKPPNMRAMPLRQGI